MKKHIATCASLADYGSDVGTHYMHTVEDIIKASEHYARYGGMKRFRWRNDATRAEFGEKLKAAQLA